MQSTRKILCRLLTFSVLLAVAAAGGGCNMIAAPLSIMAQDQTKKVPAEYAGLPNKTVVIWVWADESLLFDYPILRLDVANHVKFYLQQHVKNIKIVDPDRVNKFQRSDYEADSLPVVRVGRKFDADDVLFVQVSDFLTKPASAPNLFQGRMNAQCALYDCKGDLPVESANRKLWSGKIDVTYPEHPVGMMEASDMTIRSVLLKLFGESLAKKFYESQEPANK